MDWRIIRKANGSAETECKDTEYMLLLRLNILKRMVQGKLLMLCLMRKSILINFEKQISLFSGEKSDKVKADCICIIQKIWYY